MDDEGNSVVAPYVQKTQFDVNGHPTTMDYPRAGDRRHRLAIRRAHRLAHERADLARRKGGEALRRAGEPEGPRKGDSEPALRRERDFVVLSRGRQYCWRLDYFSDGTALRLAEPQGFAPNAAAVVKPQAYVPLDPVPRGKELEVAVVGGDRARVPHELAQAQRRVPDSDDDPPPIPTGIKLGDTMYPSGRLQKFAFSPTKPLDVYTGRVTLRLKLLAQGERPPGGSVTIPMTLRYQACNDAACLPPVKVLVNVPIEIVAAGVKARPVHPELFSDSTPIIPCRSKGLPPPGPQLGASR